MKQAKRRQWIITLSIAMVATLGIVISLLVLGSPERDLTIAAYSDVVRFQADGVATLQVRIFDLSGKVVWDSSVVSGDTIDWDRNNDFGERLAYGAYIYSAQGWSASGDLNFQKNGKLALMPGDKVQLQAPPVAIETATPVTEEKPPYAPMAYNDSNFYISGHLGVGTDNPQACLDVRPSASEVGQIIRAASGQTANLLRVQSSEGLTIYGTDSTGRLFSDTNFYIDIDHDNNQINKRFVVTKDGMITDLFRVQEDGRVGIGTSSPTAKLTIEDTAGQDLIAAYNSSNRVFVVESTGAVRADGAYYSGTGGFITGGGADVAERINTSEWVEAGNVVEIDPEHTGFFRKSSSPYSTKVAGIISTSPGVILGNELDAAADDWEDNRPVLAVTGRVPCKVSAENGPIEIGDLLVASSTPGVAMKGNPDESMGAVVGKAMEPLENGTGTIVVQVMLR